MVKLVMVYLKLKILQFLVPIQAVTALRMSVVRDTKQITELQHTSGKSLELKFRV